ncbi:MAG TPA: oxygen-independent coproporphyrinogen III oxidase [Dokdonella sp.]|uniref:oxygen-independent coproporphyrinogen III oxidase n=1 Tax=Dokdonella sp. TaxID=2291710 RepID=UPI0025BAA3F1|nr:oxygen-independent coproporphyrinogen III oxidase [Dokdonella sp.]HNR91357.1 oxygen-independent coproporphyrinogen III oxidase [Dokdonella sp.]
MIAAMLATSALPVTPSAPQFDRALIERYELNGPRYTSYPTAPHFRTDFGEAEFRAAVRASNEDPIPHPLSLYVHVPFCPSPCFYCGCTRIITRDASKPVAYVDRLVREASLLAPLFDRDREVIQLHFGGGTPNVLDEPSFDYLMSALGHHFSLSHAPSREFGIEVDPRLATPGDIARFARLGFNRLSLGIQDFDPDVQRAVNRVQGVAETQALLEAARAHGFRSTSVDLIYGLPLQTEQRFADTLDRVVAMRPGRIVTYAYAHLPERFPAQRRIDRHELPDAATRLGLLELAVERLCAAGYVYIGMDHFALPEDDLALAQAAGTLQRNFQGYSTHARTDLVALGMSSISHVGASFSQNARDLKSYEAAIDAGHLPVCRGLALDADDLIRADVIQQLMCNDAVDVRRIESQHRIDFASYFREALDKLAEMAADGLVSLSPTHIRVHARGRLLLRNVAMCFDRYLGRGLPAALRYSKTV